MQPASLRRDLKRAAPLDFWLTAALAVAAALAPRLVALLGSDFPLNDGGLFAVMIREIADAGFRLPSTTAYNSAGIPFAYPPLPLYLAAALFKLTGVGIPTLLRWLPFLANLGTVVAFCALARSLLRDRASAFVASLLFPTLPYSIEWLLTGAGLTRSFGVLFVTLGALAGHHYLKTRRAVFLMWTSIVASCAVLSHPEAGPSLAVVLAVFWLVLARDRAGVPSAGALAAGIATLTAPWWLTVLVRHGIGPFMAAGATSDWSWARLMALPAFSISGETTLTPVAVLALVGFAFDLSRRRPLLPVWLVASYLFPRIGSREVILPLALLAGEAIGEVVFPALRRASLGLGRDAGAVSGPPPPSGGAQTPRRFPDLAPLLLVVFLVCHGVLSNAFRLAPSHHPIPALTDGERAAMAWIAAQTPIGSRFVVLTSSDSWAEDPTGEWFPALTHRVSVATPQGREWLPGGRYRQCCAAYDALKRCSGADVACLDGWGLSQGMTWTHVFISKEIRGEYVPRALLNSIAASPEYALVYNGQGAFVFVRRRAPSQRDR